MQLVDKGVLTMDTTLSELLPQYKQTDKANITLRRMLTHTARLKSWIPYYINTMDSLTGKPKTKWYKPSYSKDFPYKVASKMFIKREYKDSIYRFIRESELRETQEYKYSDLPYYLLMKYLEIGSHQCSKLRRVLHPYTRSRPYGIRYNKKQWIQTETLFFFKNIFI